MPSFFYSILKNCGLTLPLKDIGEDFRLKKYTDNSHLKSKKIRTSITLLPQYNYCKHLGKVMLYVAFTLF